jgi:hypothetical protein
VAVLDADRIAETNDADLATVIVYTYDEVSEIEVTFFHSRACHVACAEQGMLERGTIIGMVSPLLVRGIDVVMKVEEIGRHPT